METIEKQPTVAVHLSQTGIVQITFKDAVAAMDEAAGEAVLTIQAGQLTELRDALLEFVPVEKV